MNTNNYTHIHFRYLLKPKAFSNKTQLKKFIATVLLENQKPLKSITYVFCNDEFLYNLNKRFLNHDTYTDILTFDMSNEKEHLSAEIYISVERVISNAIQLKQQFTTELHRVIFHGLLHLVEFKDKTVKQKAEMTRMENLLLSRYFVSREIDEPISYTFPVKP